MDFVCILLYCNKKIKKLKCWEVTKLTGKLKTWEKIVEIISLLLIVAAGIFKAVSGDVDGGLLGVLIFIGIMLFVIFLVAALFPATWRMTKMQKEKIDDEAKYQEKYTKSFVIVSLILCLGYSLLLAFLPI